MVAQKEFVVRIELHRQGPGIIPALADRCLCRGYKGTVEAAHLVELAVCFSFIEGEVGSCSGSYREALHRGEVKLDLAGHLEILSHGMSVEQGLGIGVISVLGICQLAVCPVAGIDRSLLDI